MLLNGRAPRPGEVVRLPNLAKTFKELVERGKDGFYKGRIAQAIVDLIQSKGGVMELEDLTAHTSTFVEPIKYTYAGEVTVYEVSAPASAKLSSVRLMAFYSVLLMVKGSRLLSPLVYWNRCKNKGLFHLCLSFLITLQRTFTL